MNVLGWNGWSRNDILSLLELVRQGKLDLVLHPERFPLERTVDAMRLLDDQQVYGKVAVTPA